MSLTFTAPLRSSKPRRNVAVIMAGASFSLAIQKNGRAWGWGINTSGFIGDNSTIQRRAPVSVAGAVKTFCDIRGGGTHSLAIDKNGRAWGWGGNTSGQLGDNSITSKLTPVSVLGTVKTFCKIGAGNAHSLAIDKNGRAWGWGQNSFGQIGDNSVTSRLTPVSVLGTVKTFCEISGARSGNTSLAIDKNGRAWAWGQGNLGQLGDNSIISKNTPVSVQGAVKTFCKISAGNAHALVIDKNGRVWAWGTNGSGQLGDNSITQRNTPVSVLGAIKTFCQISAGGAQSLAIDKDGQVWAWGLNSSGQLGDNSLTNRLTPITISGVKKTFCKISAGQTFCLAIDKNSRAWGWGDNASFQLGSNLINCRSTPVAIAGTQKTFCTIISGLQHSVAIDKNGRAWGWGLNNFGQIGDNSIINRATPVSVLGAIKTFCKIAAGTNFSLAIDKNGRAWAWGTSSSGQLGDNSIFSKRTPVSVLGAIKTFCQISAGGAHSLAIDKNGRAWAWGISNLGQLGDNSIINKCTPVSVQGTVKTFCQISGGNSHSLAIDKNGRVWAWGFNTSGQLGDNSIISKNTPVSVQGAVKTFCQISGGNSHSLAIDKNGRAWGWGVNTSGQIGDNSVTQRNTPVSILGAIKTFCQISGGNAHSLAIDKNGRAWAWGLNSFGQIGDNSATASYLTPVSVAGAIKTFCQINCKFNHSLAIDKDGKVWAWGDNANGRLGINLDTIVLSPIQVCNI